jgi:hypothetical protein
VFLHVFFWLTCVLNVCLAGELPCLCYRCWVSRSRCR